MPIIRVMYHTQGCKLPYLMNPIKCKRYDAWLGTGYYFWDDEQDAIIWGKEGKTSFGKFVVYISSIICDDVLDTVFNESHYKFFVKHMDRIADDIFIKHGRRATIKEMNDILIRNNVWKNMTGIMFQDISTNAERNKIQKLYYRKRIQLVAFDLNIVSTFAVHYEAAC